jgi:hypothetical protein
LPRQSQNQQQSLAKEHKGLSVHGAYILLNFSAES